MADEGRRGRDAARPTQIPALGWKDIGKRVWREVKKDNVGFVSAGVTFYLLLGIFPLLVAFVGIYGLISDPSEVVGHVRSLAGVIPADMLAIIEGELKRVAAQQDAAGLGVFIGIALALWGGTKATGAMIEAANIAYDEDDRRNFVWKKLVALGLAAGAALFLTLVIGLLAVIPAVVALFSFPEGVEQFLSLARWPALFLLAMAWLAVFYRYAPCRSKPKWRWVSWGSLVATTLWVLGSIGFSFYVGNFGNYGGSYGSLAAVIVLLMWCYITSFCVMLGAEINAEIEHQTAVDSTTGEPQPRGERGAYVADDLGEATA